MRSPYIYHQWRLQKFLRMVFGNIYVLPLETTTVYIKKLSITWVGYVGLTCGLIFGLDVQIFWVGCSNIFGGCSRKAKLKYYMYSINFGGCSSDHPWLGVELPLYIMLDFLKVPTNKLIDNRWSSLQKKFILNRLGERCGIKSTTPLLCNSVARGGME